MKSSCCHADKFPSYPPSLRHSSIPPEPYSGIQASFPAAWLIEPYYSIFKKVLSPEEASVFLPVLQKSSQSFELMKENAKTEWEKWCVCGRNAKGKWSTDMEKMQHLKIGDCYKQARGHSFNCQDHNLWQGA